MNWSKVIPIPQIFHLQLIGAIRPKQDLYNLREYCHKSNLVVTPSKGTAIMWYNHFMDPENGWMGEMDPYSIHGGCAVRKGIKWIANNWITAPYKKHAHVPSRYILGPDTSFTEWVWQDQRGCSGEFPVMHYKHWQNNKTILIFITEGSVVNWSCSAMNSDGGCFKLLKNTNNTVRTLASKIQILIRCSSTFSIKEVARNCLSIRIQFILWVFFALFYKA